MSLCKEFHEAWYRYDVDLTPEQHNRAESIWLDLFMPVEKDGSAAGLLLVLARKIIHQQDEIARLSDNGSTSHE